MQNDTDQRVRFLSYTMARPYLKDPNLSIYEFMPLNGDPTVEEIEKMQQENLEKEMKAARKMYDETMKAVTNARV